MFTVGSLNYGLIQPKTIRIQYYSIIKYKQQALEMPHIHTTHLMHYDDES
jgi:hypothetical protein